MSALLLDRYEVIEEIGSGGFASVVVAWDTRIQRKVAIKCLPLGDSFNNTDCHSVGSILLEENAPAASEIPGLEEARTAAMLNDAHIVSVYDFELQDDMAYVILEYIEGQTLGDVLRDYSHEITPDVVAAVFYAVSHALEVAHRNHVLHLDIKPDNVLIDTQGLVKVVDFGLARLLGEQGFGVAAGGTIGYMPLEQMRQEPLDERCDEWALASLTYEMIVGDNPFSASTLAEAEQKITNAELVVPSVCMEDVDPSIDDIMFCALDPNPDERYDSVADFAHEMQQCLGNRRKGVKQLARLVGQIEEEDAEEEPPVEQDHDKEPLSQRTKAVLMRTWSVLGVAVIGFVSLQNIPYLEGGWTNPVTWGIYAVLLAVGALLPSVGVLVSLGCFGVMLVFNEAPLAGVFLIAVAFAWWISVGRKGIWQANIGAASVLFGAIGCAPLAPLLAGYALRLRDALLTSAFSVCFAAVFAGLGSGSLLGWNVFQYHTIRMWTHVNENLLPMLQSFDFWFSALAWLIAAALLVACCSRGSRVLACIGVVLGVACMIVALVVGAVMNAGISGDVMFTVDPFAILSVVGAGIIMMVVCSVSFD